MDDGNPDIQLVALAETIRGGGVWITAAREAIRSHRSMETLDEQQVPARYRARADLRVVLLVTHVQLLHTRRKVHPDHNRAVLPMPQFRCVSVPHVLVLVPAEPDEAPARPIFFHGTTGVTKGR